MTTDEHAPHNPLLAGYFDDLARLARLAELNPRRLDGAQLSPDERALLVPLGAAPALSATSPATVTDPTRPAFWIGIAAALAGLALLLYQPWGSEPARDAGWLAKSGETFAVHVLVERDGVPTHIHSGDRVRTGEQFGLFLDSPARGYGAVWFVEASAPPTLLFPRTGVGRLRAGDGIALPDGGAFTRTDQTCEWIIGVHAREPIDRDGIVAALRSAKHGPNCRLTVAPPQGLRVAIVTLRRTQANQ